MLGVQKIDPVLGAYSTYTGSVIVHQGFGAVITLVLYGLWNARGHLRDVCRKAFTGTPAVDDSDEILSYRAALLILCGSLASATRPIAACISVILPFVPRLSCNQRNPPTAPGRLVRRRQFPGMGSHDGHRHRPVPGRRNDRM